MRDEQYNIDGLNYIRVSKQCAKKAYIRGYNVVVAPVKWNMYSMWRHYVILNKDVLKNRHGYTPHFDSIVNEFEFYNCNLNEEGKYAKFFMYEDEFLSMRLK